MAFNILTENSVDNTNIDGARAEHFNAGLRDGIVKGAFNEGVFSALASNVISFDTCELRISGHRVIIDEIWTQTFSSSPSVATRYALVGQIVVDSSSNVDFSLFVQNASTALVKDNLFRTKNGAGTYQVEIGRFTLTTLGTITDVVRTLDTITGGSSGMGEHFTAGDISTTMLESGMQANVTAEDVYDANGDYKQTDFSFELPETAGTVVKVNNIEQANLDFTSDPQTQLNNKVNKSDIDSALSSASENPVQNKVVKNALDAKANTSTLDDYVTKTTTQEVSGAKTFTGDNTYKTSGATYGAKIPDTTGWSGNKTIATTQDTKPFINISLSQEVTLSANSETKASNLSNNLNNGTNFAIDNGDVVVTGDTGYVKITSIARFYPGSQGDCSFLVRIKKNGTVVADTSVSLTLNAYNRSIVPLTTIINVSNNDKISFHFESNLNNTVVTTYGTKFLIEKM